MSGNRIVPALNATSDMPVVTPVEAPVVADAVETALTPTTTEAITTETPVVETPTPPTPPPSDKTIPGRFSELAQQRREAELRASRLEALANQQAERIEALLNLNTRPMVPEPTVVVPDTSDETVIPRPIRDAYTDPESYETALISWAGEQAAAKAVAEAQRRQEANDVARAAREREATEASAKQERERIQQESWNQQVSNWNTRRATAMEKYSDFSEVAENPDLSIPVGSPMAHAILTREDGPEIAYYLGKHPEEATRIAQLIIPGQTFPPGTPLAGMPMWDSVAQSFELGKIAAKLGVEALAPVIPPTPEPVNALATPAPVVLPSPLPEPPTPLGGSNANATYKSPADETMEEYAARRSQELLAQRRPGGRSLN